MAIGNEQILTSMERKLSRFMNDKIEELVGKEAEEQSEVFEEMQRHQLAEGTDGEGQIISPAYKPSTIAKKKREGKPYNRVTLFDTGVYYSRARVKRRGGVFEMFNEDSKDADLREKYGEDIVGLTEFSTDRVSQAMLPGLINRTRKYFGV